MLITIFRAGFGESGTWIGLIEETFASGVMWDWRGGAKHRYGGHGLEKVAGDSSAGAVMSIPVLKNTLCAAELNGGSHHPFVVTILLLSRPTLNLGECAHNMAQIFSRASFVRN